MSLLQLAVRSGTFYWRTNLAVLLGVAAAVAVLGGALLVGETLGARSTGEVLPELVFVRLRHGNGWQGHELSPTTGDDQKIHMWL